MKCAGRLSLIGVLALGLSACGEYPHVNTLKLNETGNKSLTSEQTQGALDSYIEALRYSPFQPELHLNLGLTFEMMEQFEKAAASYQEAERLAMAQNNLEVTFMARFNLAQLRGKEKKVDEALALYQKALELAPASKEIKINIELLTQQQQGGGQGEGQDNQDNQDQQDNKGDQNKDQKDQKDGEDKKDPKDSEGDKDEKEQKPKQVQGSPKYKPRPFDGKELSEGDVKKILGELKQQEERIRSEFNRKEVKEQPRDKDW